MIAVFCKLPFDTHAWLGGKSFENVADEAGLTSVFGRRVGTWATTHSIHGASETIGARTADREFLVETGAGQDSREIRDRNHGNSNDTISSADSLICRRHGRQAKDEAASGIERQTHGADLAETGTHIIVIRYKSLSTPQLNKAVRVRHQHAKVKRSEAVPCDRTHGRRYDASIFFANRIGANGLFDCYATAALGSGCAEAEEKNETEGKRDDHRLSKF